MVRSWGVRILRVNTVGMFSWCENYLFPFTLYRMKNFLNTEFSINTENFHPCKCCNARIHTFWHLCPMIQISQHICIFWTVFIIRMRKLCILGYPKCAQWMLWSDCANSGHIYLKVGFLTLWLKKIKHYINPI